MDFFLSPGFGGLCAVIGAAIAHAAATVSTRQKARADAEIRRQAEIARAWDRFVWLMEHRGELDPEVIFGLLQRIGSTAAALGDADLAAFTANVSTDLLRAGLSIEPPPPWTRPPHRANTGTDDEGM